MKLLRFELAGVPGDVRSGIVYGSKVYETDGANAIGVHEWSEVVPFIPTGQPPSYRMFRADAEQDAWLRDEASRPFHIYLNPAGLIPTNRILSMPDITGELGYEPQVAVVAASAASQISPDAADGLILGVTIANTFVARDIERAENQHGQWHGRSRDAGTAIGPFLTTPEELDDLVVDDSRGRRYRFEAIVRVNGDEVAREDLTDLPYTMAELLSYASESCPLMAGDLVSVGPISLIDNKAPLLEPGDEVQITIDRLGTLTTRIG